MSSDDGGTQSHAKRVCHPFAFLSLLSRDTGVQRSSPTSSVRLPPVRRTQCKTKLLPSSWSQWPGSKTSAQWLYRSAIKQQCKAPDSCPLLTSATATRGFSDKVKPLGGKTPHGSSFFSDDRLAPVARRSPKSDSAIVVRGCNLYGRTPWWWIIATGRRHFKAARSQCVWRQTFLSAPRLHAFLWCGYEFRHLWWWWLARLQGAILQDSSNEVQQSDGETLRTLSRQRQAAQLQVAITTLSSVEQQQKYWWDKAAWYYC